MFNSQTAELLKLQEDPERWMNKYLISLSEKSNNPDIQKRLAAREAIRPYAKFICDTCGELYTEETAVLAQGVCGQHTCSGVIVDNPGFKAYAKAEEDQVLLKHPELGDLYECTSCSNEEYYENIVSHGLNCENCGASRFAKVSTMESVVQNTLDINSARGMPIVSAEHKNGQIYAYYSFGHEDEQVSVIVKAKGDFTPNDFVDFDINNGNPRAIVATLIDDPLVKVANNEKCQCYWLVDDSSDDDIPSASYVDSDNRKIEVGAIVEWNIPNRGIVEGIVSSTSIEGIAVELHRHPEWGLAKDGKHLCTEVYSQDEIMKSGITVVS